MKTWSLVALASVPIALTAGVLALAGAAPADEHPANFTGGHEIGRNDLGRPCVLIAAALGVKTEVFREAFRGVSPAKGRGPSGEEARKNKDALLKVLAPYGVTNERLDEVSNYYRFNPQDGELWKHQAAKAHAVVEAGKLKSVVIDDPGAGYSTPPKVTFRGFEKVEFLVTLRFDEDLSKNGSIRSIAVKTR